MANPRESFGTTSSLLPLLPRVSVGLGQREVDLNQLLLSSNISVAGLTGMSGMGKSALASLLFQTRRSGYERASFLENVRGRSTEDLQRQLLVDLCGTVDWDKSKYAAKIQQMVGTLRVLVVVDDVACEDELEALQVSAFREERAVKKKSKAVVTGQDWQVMQDYISSGGRVQLELLDEWDGMALFSHYAFDGATAYQDRQRLLRQLVERDRRSFKQLEHVSHNMDNLFRAFETASAEIVRACAGNPGSLQMVGDFLGKKKSVVSTESLLEMYGEAVYKLNHAQMLGGSKRNDRLWARLWDRFHDLDRPERDLLVELAAFMEQARPAMTTVGSVDREAFLRLSKSGSPRISLQNLIDKSFVAEKTPGGVLTMHSHFQAMARKIAADNEERALRQQRSTNLYF